MFPELKVEFFNNFSNPVSAEFNMAFDEALLHRKNVPWLRLYKWQQITASIGYFMPSANRDEDGMPWVRRWTGGGMVTHGQPDETTFSLGMPDPFIIQQSSSRIYYREIHKRVQDVLMQQGFSCEMIHNESSAQGDLVCFERAVSSDLVHPDSGQKIVGGALRRTREGLLYQGSIQCLNLPENFGLELAASLALEVEELKISSEVEELAGVLAIDKYSSPEWKYAR